MNDENETMAESDGNASYVIAPEELLEIPPGYNAPCDRPGTLERFEYNTFEAFSYEDRSRPLGKDAIVYVPAGYDAGLRYNVVYLMHGGVVEPDDLPGHAPVPERLQEPDRPCHGRRRDRAVPDRVPHI